MKSETNKIFLISAKEKYDVEFLKMKQIIKSNNVKVSILCFNKYLEEYVKGIGEYKVIGQFHSACDSHNLYLCDGILFVQPFLGGPNAAGIMEELAALGIEYFIAVGSACKADKLFDSSKLLIASSAVRGDGCGYYYLPKRKKAQTNEEVNGIMVKTFSDLQIEYEFGNVFTTDAYYRESIKLIDKMVKKGVKALDMECSTWCLVAEALNVKFGQFFYFSDFKIDNTWGKITFNEKLKKQMHVTKIAHTIAKNIINLS